MQSETLNWVKCESGGCPEIAHDETYTYVREGPAHPVPQSYTHAEWAGFLHEVRTTRKFDPPEVNHE